MVVISMEGYVEYKKDEKNNDLTLEIFSFAAQVVLLAFGSHFDVTGQIFESIIKVSIHEDK